MANKLRLWNEQTSWEKANALWEKESKEAASLHPLKAPKHMPSMVGITKDTAKNLKWKALKYMAFHDLDGSVRKGVMKKPFHYTASYLRSLWGKNSYTRDGDFFLYGIKAVSEFEALLEEKESLLVVGFSYCHKPHECPSGRFSTECIHDRENPICRQCFIGKVVHALPEEACIPLFITTVHYIGGKMLEISHANPDKKVLFIITACEMTLEMFSDWGNMIGIRGVGVRLGGRICNTMKAFELSEAGIKPGLTIVEEPTKQRILDLVRHRREKGCK